MRNPERRPVAVIATLATDILTSPEGVPLGMREGGPALFIQQALMNERVPYRITLNDPLRVPIIVSAQGEIGISAAGVTPRNVTNDMFEDWTILSSIAGEWQVPANLRFPDYLFMDAQGFVRNPDNFRQSNIWYDLQKYMGRIFCLKATSEELRRIGNYAVHDQQQNRLLLVTKGSFGFELYCKGVKTAIRSRIIRNLPDTIGAGDTLLTYFAIAMRDGLEPLEAAKKAADQTADFLEAKKRGQAA